MPEDWEEQMRQAKEEGPLPRIFKLEDLIPLKGNSIQVEMMSGEFAQRELGNNFIGVLAEVRIPPGDDGEVGFIIVGDADTGLGGVGKQLARFLDNPRNVTIEHAVLSGTHKHAGKRTYSVY